jgi:hypothetical protein
MFNPYYQQTIVHNYYTASATASVTASATASATVVAALISNGNASVTSIDDLKSSAQLVQTRLYSRWVSQGRFLPAHARHASLVPSLHEHASDCFAALSECKTKGRRLIVVVCFSLKAFLTIADCYRVAIQTRMRNEILSITSVFLRK